MRALLCLFSAIAVAGSAAAQDRYGPESANSRARTAAIASGRMLTWAGKTVPTPPPPPPTAVALARTPAPNSLLRNTSAYVAAPQAYAEPAPAPQPTAAAPAENAPWRRLTGIAAATPQSNPPAIPTTRVEAQGPLAPAAPAAQAPAQPQADLSARSTPAAQGEQAKYYSLHRDYGQTPDPVAIPEKRQVFLAGGPLTSDLDPADDEIDDTGKTAAAKKARIAADWGAADDPPADKRVQVRRN